MPSAFVQPDASLLRACEESLVLTSNERLRRELVRAYDVRQQRNGRRAWRSARVQSFESYLAEQYRELCSTRGDCPRLLSPEAELLLFAQLAPEGAGDSSRTALQAWNLAHDWQIPLARSSFSHTENGRVFLEWAERVRGQLTATACITRGELAGFLTTRQAAAPRALVCVGFEAMSRAAVGYFEALQRRGVNVDFRAPRHTRPRRVIRCELPTRAAELAAVAQWSRAVLETSPRARVGVVVPDLTSRYHAVVRQFGAELHEFGRAEPGAGFDVAAGLSLADQPIWRDARGLLELCMNGVPPQTLRSLVASPYLELPRGLHLPADMRSELDLRQVAEVAGRTVFASLQRLCWTAHRQDSFRAWVGHFSGLLQAAGWSGARAGSAQFQAWEQLQAALGRAASSPDEFRCTGQEALSSLDHVLQTRIFAPRTAAAPVQIMGYLETTGLRFTHLWVTGMQDTAWPTQPTPNPFVPLSTAHRHAVPRIDQRGELEFARSRLEHWVGSSARVVFSHAVDDGESHHLPSPLTAPIPTVPVRSLVRRWRPRSHPFFVPRQGVLELIHDDHGTALPAGQRRGGSGLLRDQAACPFRAWAIHRLGLRDVRDPHDFPDAMDRGNLVHEALQRMAGAPGYPRALDSDEIARAAEGALNQRYARFPAPFRQRELTRLTDLLHAWCALEQQRSEFRVVGLESAAELEVAGLTLSLRLDRIDEVDGRFVIIDYKTGRVRARGMTTGRLLEPQLPAYSVSHEGVGAVLFGQVQESRPRLVGLADEAVALDGAQLERLPCASWTQLERRWSAQLQTLAEEFLAGSAAVTPAEADTCERCHLQRFCRIRAEPVA